MATAAEKTANKTASQKAAMDSFNNSGLTPWIGGINIDRAPFTDVYDAATGDLKTFTNKAGDKISGRIVADKDGREVKLYNAFLQKAMEGSVNNVKIEQVDGKDGKFPFVSVNGAVFGIYAVPSLVDTDQVNPTTGTPYKRIDHYLQKTKAEKAPAPATV